MFDEVREICWIGEVLHSTGLWQDFHTKQ
ncbi:uncharacterized protein METZ01_LOCUS494335, partial [marine metagenome]